jgi:4-amino-4-deoxy-L-arabinose transferase-like glycosyltransferase
MSRLSERQMALLVVLGGLLLYLPFAGSYGLWDPWETHYAEVARQMTHRGDYISLWWPGSPRDPEVFWSKPVLSFWLMSLAMHLGGIGLPGGVPGEMALSHRAEWAARLPFCLMGVLGIYAIYLVTSRLASRRAGVLAAVVTATAPMYSLVARQAMTDMAFVGPMAMAIALAALAVLEPDEQELPRRGTGRRSWPHHGLFYGTVGLFLLTTIPQLIVDSVQLRVFIPRGDHELQMYGVVAMIPYIVGAALFVYLAARTRTKAPFYLYLAAILCGISVLAKGLAGLGLPLIVFAFFLAFTGQWRRLGRGQLRYAIVVALIALVVVAVPWHHAMLIRHGAPFWDELFGDNHWRRMVIGRHGDRGSFEYFLREAGYGCLPWLAFAPAALAWAALRRPQVVARSSAIASGEGGLSPPEPIAGGAGPSQGPELQSIIWLGAIWFVLGYAVVSLSMTKFHHYVLPAIPGLAIVVGCFLDDLIERRAWRAAALAVAVGLPLLFLTAADLIASKSAAQRFLWLFSYDYVHNRNGRLWPDRIDFSGALMAFTALFALTSIAVAIPRLRRLGAWGLSLAAVAFTYFLLDDYMPTLAPYWSQKGPIATYYRERRSPAERLVAFMLYWRGETFYTSNEIYEGPTEERTVFDQDGAEEKLKAWMSHHRGERVFFLMERSQQLRIQGLLPPGTRDSFRVIDEQNNKFALAVAEL